MKKSTIVLTITGVVFTIIGITCLVAASVKLADMGIDTAAGSLDGEEYTWNIDSWNCPDESYADSGKEDVDVNLPGIDVHVDDDKVNVNLPGIHVNVDDDTGKVHVDLGDGTEASDSTAETTK